MKLGVTIVVALVLINVEAAVLHLVGATLVKIDVGLAIVAFLSLHFMPLEGAIGAFFIGYFEDLLCGHPTGLYAFLAVLTFLLARVAGAAVDVRGAIGFGAFAGITSLVFNVLAYLFSLLAAGSDEVRGVAVLASALPTALWTGLFAVPLFFLLRAIESRFVREETGLLR